MNKQQHDYLARRERGLLEVLLDARANVSSVGSAVGFAPRGGVGGVRGGLKLVGYYILPKLWNFKGPF